MERERPVGARWALALINKQTSKSLLVCGLWDVVVKDIHHKAISQIIFYHPYINHKPLAHLPLMCLLRNSFLQNTTVIMLCIGQKATFLALTLPKCSLTS